MTDDLKQGIERGTGDKFIERYNELYGRGFSFIGRPEEAPDLLYRDSEETVALEITTVWYSQEHAKGTMKFLREKPNAPLISPLTHDPEKALAQNICEAIEEKCRNDYGSNCLLIVRIGSDALTTEQEMESEVIPNIAVPHRQPFTGIYLMDRAGDHIWSIT